MDSSLYRESIEQSLQLYLDIQAFIQNSIMMLLGSLPAFLAVALASLSSASVLSDTTPVTTYSQCQKKTPDVRDGCPPGTIFVSASDPGADFSSIQAAIRSLPNDTSAHTILIGAGIYREQVNVTRSGPVTLLGQTDRPSQRALYADVETGAEPSNEVHVIFNAANQNFSYPDNIYTSVLAVGPSYNATQTGIGPIGYPVPPDTPFGCADFRAYNIDFRNEFAPYSAGPAHAVAVGYANTGFYSCGFYSYQDTVYVGKLGNAVMYDSVIAGQTDFLYGFGTLFVHRSSLLLRSCGGGITAWKGTNTTEPNKFGVYVSSSQIIAANATILENQRGRCSLGRPWNELHRSVIMDTYMDETILPAGYTIWEGQPFGRYTNATIMAVYDTYGPGDDEEAQKKGRITRVFEKKDVKPYFRPKDVFATREGAQPNVDWIDPVALKQCSWRS
jgi:pectin methylesterase-like acyl-CoA thioesterase